MFGLTRWSQNDEFDLLGREMDRLFDRVLGGFTPRFGATGLVGATGLEGITPGVEMRSAEDGWHLKVAVPGIDPSQLQTEVVGRVLAIRGEEPQGAGTDGYRFERRLTLPDSVDADNIRASYRYGVLEIVLPLREEVRPRKIAIEGVERKALSSSTPISA